MLTVAEVVTLKGLSKSGTYFWLKEQGIPVVKIGQVGLVKLEDLG